jgi:hypothetical protein
LVALLAFAHGRENERHGLSAQERRGYRVELKPEAAALRLPGRRDFNKLILASAAILVGTRSPAFGHDEKDAHRWTRPALLLCHCVTLPFVARFNAAPSSGGLSVGVPSG